MRPFPYFPYFPYLCLALLLIVSGGTLAWGAPAPAKRLFHLTFDGANALTAAQAGGNGEPAQAEGVAVVPGLRGRGVFLSRESILAYAEAGNLDKARGSLEIWFQPSFERDAFTSRKAFYPCLFKEDAPLGPVAPDPVNNLWLWFTQGQLRYDLRVSPRNDVLLAGLPGGLKDVWRQVVITWDSRFGSAIFLNGRRMPPFVSDRPFGVLPPVTWTPRAPARFFLGNRGRDTYHTPEPLWGGCECVLDEVAIYDRPLEDDEVLRAWGSAFGPARGAPLVLARRGAIAAGDRRPLTFDVKNPNPFPLDGRLSIAMEGPGGRRALYAGPVRLRAGQVSALAAPPVRLSAGTYSICYTFAGVAIYREPFSVLAAPSSAPTAAAPKLLARCDAVSLRGTDRFRESAPTRVGNLQGAPYVESGPNRFDRMAIRFQVRNPGRPHLLKVYYPDDRERIFDAIISSPSAPCAYDAQGGVVAGKEFENTGAVQCYEMLFWPREKDAALTLTTWAAGRPAALSAFEVFEMGDALPPLPLQAAPNGRGLGLYWEDPMISECFGGRHHEADPERFTAETADRLVEYLRWTGMNTLIYPVAFYQGPGFATLAENLVAGSGFERHPPNYVDILLRRFEAAGNLAFLPEINLCLSGSMLLPVREHARTPAKGYLAVSSEGRTNDAMFPRLNVLHPRYQDALAGLFREMCRRWGDSPAFRGVQLHVVIESSFWFGGPEWGYDDFTVGLFRQESGEPLPEFAGEGRCRERYAWLRGHAWQKWIAWRCERVARFYGRLAGILHETRPDLNLVVGLRYLAEGDRDLARWSAAGRSMRTLYREGGFDFERMARIPNLVLQKYFYPNDMAWQTASRSGNAHYLGLEMRRSDELRQTLTLSGTRPVATNLYLNYFESDVDARTPLPGFWWRAPEWRVCAPSPSGRSYLELFAESVALYDAPFITTGGYVVGTLGHDAHVQEFARAYRTLPAIPFRTLPQVSDVAVVRAGQGGYLYAVSRAPFAVTLHLRLSGQVKLRDLSDGSTLSDGAPAIALQPYQLRAFRADQEVAPENVSIDGCDIPPDRKARIETAIAQLQTRPAPGPAIAADLRRELDRQCYVRCKHLLEEVRTLDLLAR